MIARYVTATAEEKVAALFRDAVPSLTVVEDRRECALASCDIAAPGATTAAAILRPENQDEVLALVDIARREGCALFPRGGGWSYSGGYTPSQSPAVIVDTGRLLTITVDREAACVTVGAGVTWSALDDTLNATRLRVPSFGPLSGIGATVGGLVAQNGGFFGAAGYGPIADSSIISSTIITGSGEAVTVTAEDRVGGPVAPQPFAGDCGAFGLRTEITLATIARPSTTLFASFAFSAGEQALTALCSLAGTLGLGEAYVFDPGAHANLARSGFSIVENAAFAGDLLVAAKSALDGVANVVRAVRWNRAAIADIGWSLHISVEGDEAETQEALAEIDRRVRASGGRPIPDVIPRVTRARPFRRIRSLLGPEGEVWLPAHGVFSLDAACRALNSLTGMLDDRAEVMRSHEIRTAILAVLMGNRVVIEPQLFWPDSLSPLHRRLCQPDQLAAFGDRPDRPAARASALVLRRAAIDAMDAAGATHFQIGRTYAARPGVADAVRAGWRSWKRRLDPDRIMNPGVLGL